MRHVSAKVWNGKKMIEMKGHFHEFGLELFEGYDEIFNYTVAIIEDYEGKIWTTAPDNIIFLTK